MFNFKKVTKKDYIEKASDYMPGIPKRKETQQEFFRVGITADGNTSLTLLLDGGMSTTMTMDKKTCEQLIKMLRATYQDE